MHLLIDARKLRHGGIGRYIENLLLGLMKEPGLELTVVCSSSQDVESIKEFANSKPSFNFLVDCSNQYSFGEYFLFPLKYRKSIELADWYISPHYTLPFFISTKKLVVIHDCIHVSYPDSLIHKWVGRFLISSALKRADKVLTVSETSRDSLVREFGAKASQVQVVHNSLLPILNAPIFEANTGLSQGIRLLYVGADRAHKRFRLFLDFIKLLKNSDLDFHATIVSELKENSLLFLKENGLTSQVSVCSGLSNQELLELYSSSNFLICTSAEEGFCLPLLEAMSIGLSILAPLRPYSQELVSEAGWYFAPGSAADLFRVFVMALQDIGLREKRIQLGLANAKNYSLDSNTNKFLVYLRAA